ATSQAGSAIETVQAISTSSNAPVTRYWLWRFDRPDDPVGLEDFWGKTQAQAVTDLQAANDPLVGLVTGPCDVELSVDAYFPNTVPSVAPELRGRTVHPGGRNRVLLDGHAQYLKKKCCLFDNFFFPPPPRPPPVLFPPFFRSAARQGGGGGRRAGRGGNRRPR